MRTMIKKQLLPENSYNLELFRQHSDGGETLPAHWSASPQVKTLMQLYGAYIIKLCIIYPKSAPST